MFMFLSSNFYVFYLTEVGSLAFNASAVRVGRKGKKSLIDVVKRDATFKPQIPY